MEDILRNGSGYVDLTAYQAMKNCLKGQKKMEIYQGDIFTGELNNGNEREFIILSVHERFCTVLMLSENESMPYQVVCKGFKYTDPGMLQYMYIDKLTDYVRSMGKEEFDALMQEVIDSLGYAVKDKPVVKEVIKEVIKEPEAAASIDSDLLIKAQAERDIYKNLYEDLLSKMMAR